MTQPGERSSLSTHEQSLLRAAEGGDVEAMRLLGAHYLRQGYEELAFTYFQKASDAGDPKAMLRVAIARTTGTGVVKSIPIALSLFEIAAKRSNLQAAQALANIYAAGKFGQPKNLDEAARWQRLAGEIEAGNYVPDHAYRARLKLDTLPQQAEEVDDDGNDFDKTADDAALSQRRAMLPPPTGHHLEHWTSALEYTAECQSDLTSAVRSVLRVDGFIAHLSAIERFPGAVTGSTFAIGYQMGLPAPVAAALTACMFPGIWRKECGKLGLMMSRKKRQRLEEYELIAAYFEPVAKALPHHVARSEDFFSRSRSALNW